MPYVNDRDFVSGMFDLGGKFPDPLGLLLQPGRGAVVQHFREKRELHSLGRTYLNHRVAFEDARAGQF